MMKVIKVYFEERDIERLNELSKARGVSRAEYVRDKVLYGTGVRKHTPKEYYELITECCRKSNMPRSAVEHCVNHVFTYLMAPHSVEASPD